MLRGLSKKKIQDPWLRLLFSLIARTITCFIPGKFEVAWLGPSSAKVRAFPQKPVSFRTFSSTHIQCFSKELRVPASRTKYAYFLKYMRLMRLCRDHNYEL